jgi:hypothetical protein
MLPSGGQTDCWINDCGVRAIPGILDARAIWITACAGNSGGAYIEQYSGR